MWNGEKMLRRETNSWSQPRSCNFNIYHPKLPIDSHSIWYYSVCTALSFGHNKYWLSVSPFICISSSISNIFSASLLRWINFHLHLPAYRWIKLEEGSFLGPELFSVSTWATVWIITMVDWDNGPGIHIIRCSCTYQIKVLNLRRHDRSSWRSKVSRREQVFLQVALLYAMSCRFVRFEIG